MSKRCVFVAMSSQKGGVGKSTMTVLLAGYFHYVMGYNVAVVDCDYPQFSIKALRSRDTQNVEKNVNLQRMLCGQFDRTGKKAYPVLTSVPGKESRHNLKYWNGDEYLGIGPSAHSFFGGRRFYTPKSLSAFFQAPQYLREDPDESAIPPGGPEEYTMLRLRLSEGLTEAGYQQRFQTPIPEKYRKNALRFQAPGLTLVDSQGIRLTRRGFLVSNQLIGEILW